MLTADFWLSKVVEAKRVIAGLEEIDDFNQEIVKKSSEYVQDLAEYPADISKEKLRSLLDESAFMAQNRYLGSQLLDYEYYRKLQTEMNVDGISDKVVVKYGFTVKRTHLRILPTHDFVTNRPEDYEFDRLQETAITAVEPLIILHTSRNGQWYFVQGYYAAGWIVAEHVAATQKRSEWLSYAAATEFLVVTGNRLRLGFNPYCPELSELEFYMGDKLRLAQAEAPQCVDKQAVAGNYIVKLPVRGQGGQLTFKLALVPIVSDVCQGYLSYTREHILRQAFKMQGDRYGWGGSFNSRDCSSFIMDTYRCFGIKLPRNTWQQMNTTGKTVNFTGKTPQERKKLLSHLEPGAALYFKGHVMLYLGEYDGEHYVLHAIAECGDGSQRSIDNTLQVIPLHNIMVTTLSLIRTNGQSLFSALTIGKLFE